MTFDTNSPLIVTSDSVWASREVIAVVTGVLLAFGLSFLTEWLKGWSRRRAHWGALSAEIEHCRHLAETYLEGAPRVMAPLYRLPTIAYAHSLPGLLSEGALKEAATSTLLFFFNEVETLNRGLDQAEHARLLEENTGSTVKLTAEFQRNRLKAEQLVPSKTSTPSYYDAANSLVRPRMRRFPGSLF